MGRGHPDQIRLEAFLGVVEKHAERELARIAGEIVVELDIGLTRDQSLTQHRDLDNYLLPVVSRIGQRRIVAAFARKHYASQSTLTVGAAQLRLDHEPPKLKIRAVGSYERPTWKEQIRATAKAHLGAHAPHTGTAALDLSFTTASARNWTSLWKPTIDALAGPLLGVPKADKPWSPNDDHITRLGLHHTIDDAVGFDVVIRAWWVLDEA